VFREGKENRLALNPKSARIASFAPSRCNLLSAPRSSTRWGSSLPRNGSHSTRCPWSKLVRLQNQAVTLTFVPRQARPGVEIPPQDGQTQALCSTLLSSSSHSAHAPSGRFVGAEATS
jgi:hypothetical protein